MERKDIIETFLTIQNPCSIPDYETHCLNEIRRLYEGRCFKGKFIKSVEKIADMSSVVINSTPIGTANVNVKFEAKVMIYPPQTVLHHCVVSRVDQTRCIMLKKDNVCIYINYDTRLLSLRTGNIINVQVGHVKYPILSRLVAVKGLPYIFPKPDETIYKINADTVDKGLIESLNIPRDSKIPAKLWNMFYVMYYPYKNQPNIKNTKSMFDLSGELYIQRPPSINEADPDVIIWKSPPDGSLVVEEDATTVLHMFAKRHYDHLRLLESMCAKFSKDSVRSANKSVWAIHNRLKEDTPKIGGLESKVKVLLSENFPRKKYVPHSAYDLSQKFMSWGQKKLLLTEIQFCTNYGHLAPTVVYAGSAPGTHMPLITDMFDHHFILHDPRNFSRRLIGNKKISTHVEYFTDEVAKKYKDQPILFISDIRRSATEDRDMESIVVEDMEWQMNWIKIMKPKMSMLKFRLPYTAGVTEYLDGKIYFQAYAPLTSTETRLVTDGKKMRKYDNCKYEDQLYYYNSVSRPNNQDEMLEMHIYEEYVNSQHNKNKLTVKDLKYKINKFLCKEYMNQKYGSETMADIKASKIQAYCRLEL